MQKQQKCVYSRHTSCSSVWTYIIYKSQNLGHSAYQFILLHQLVNLQHYMHHISHLSKKKNKYMYQFVQQEQHTFTKAPMTPKLVSLKYSKGLDLLVVLRKGYKYKGIWAAKKKKIKDERILSWNFKNSQECQLRCSTNSNSIYKHGSKEIWTLCIYTRWRLLPLRKYILVSGWEATHYKKIKN